MQTQPTRSISLVIGVLLTGLFALTPAMGSEHMPETKHYTEEEVQQKWSEAMDALKNYSAERRDEVMADIDSAMQATDARLQELETATEAQWDEMSEAAQEQSRETMANLRQQRRELSEWYGAAKYGSADAWEEIKNGFSGAYDQLSDSAKKAWAHLSGQ